MYKLFLKSLKTGKVTSRYPQVKAAPPAGFRGKPELIALKCNTCGRCAEVCPTRAIRVERNPGISTELTISLDRCIYCGACQQACRRGAVVMGSEYQLAAAHKTDLSTGITIVNCSEQVN